MAVGDGVDPRYPSCDAALQALEGPGGLPAEVCEDFRAIRQVVLCHAWHRGDHRRFEEAVQAGWDAVERACEGKASPMVGGLIEPDQLRRPLATYQVTRDGEDLARVVVESNQEIDICTRGQCATHFTSPDEAATVIAAMLDILPRLGIKMEQEMRPDTEQETKGPG